MKRNYEEVRAEVDAKLKEIYSYNYGEYEFTIRKLFNKGRKIKPLLNNHYSPNGFRIIAESLSVGFDTSKFEDPNLFAIEMKVIRHAVKLGKENIDELVNAVKEHAFATGEYDVICKIMEKVTTDILIMILNANKSIEWLELAVKLFNKANNFYRNQIDAITSLDENGLFALFALSENNEIELPYLLSLYNNKCTVIDKIRLIAASKFKSSTDINTIVEKYSIEQIKTIVEEYKSNTINMNIFNTKMSTEEIDDAIYIDLNF